MAEDCRHCICKNAFHLRLRLALENILNMVNYSLMANKDAKEELELQSQEAVVDINTQKVAEDRIHYDPSASIFLNVGEVVCVGATAIIIILLLVILLFFEFKDHDVDM